MKKVIEGLVSSRAVVMGVLSALFGWLFFSLFLAQPLPISEALTTEATVRESQKTPTTLAYPVVGEVRAKQELVVRAKRSGVVQTVLVEEGDVVSSGQLVAVQLDPVLAAELDRQKVQSTVRTLGEASNQLSKETTTASTQALEYEAIGLAVLAGDAAESQIQAAKNAGVVAVGNLASTLADTFVFIDEEPSFFSATELSLYRQLLTRWYGSEPNYLTIGPRRGGRADSLAHRLASVSEVTSPNETASLLNEAGVLLRDLEQLLTAAEKGFLDTKKLSRADERYQAYIAKRTAVATVAASVLEARLGLEQVVTDTATTKLGAVRNLAVSQVAASTASLQVKLGEEMYHQVLALGEAEQAVVEAGLAEGELRAPFAAVVGQVLVEVGEYVAAGTPLLTLVGTGETEIELKLPETLRETVSVGTPFLINDESVGAVSRLVPVVDRGSITAFIKLTAPLPVGSIARGALSLSTSTVGEMIERQFLFFGATGPYVLLDNQEMIKVTIKYDGGEWLLVLPETPLISPLQPAFGHRI